MSYSFYDLMCTRFIPDSLKFKTFSVQHFIYLAAVVLFIIYVSKYVRKCGEVKAKKILMGFSLSLIVIYFLRFALFFTFDYQYSFLDNLPFHLCIVNQFVIPYAVSSENKVLLNLTYVLSMPAAAIAMLTPGSLYIQYYYLSWYMVSFFVTHAIIVAIPIMAISAGLFRPDLKLFPKVSLAFFSYTAVIFIVNKIIGTNYMYLNKPEKGTIMEVFFNMLGNPGYIIPLFGVLFVVVILMYLPWVFLDMRKKKMELHTAAI